MSRYQARKPTGRAMIRPLGRNPRFVNGEEPLDMTRLAKGFGAH
jgi:hypothetical protein